MTPTVHIVDDDESFRIAIGRLLDASGLQVVLYESADEIVAHPPSAALGCILLDVEMPGLSGLDLQARLTEIAPALPVVFLTGHGDIQSSVRAMKAGAEDFLEKPVSGEALLAAVERALVRCQKLKIEHDRSSALKSLVARLTPREFEVFALVASGLRNKQIAFKIGTSERTVKAHRHSIMEKLEVRSLAEAVTIAETLGIRKEFQPP